MYTMHLPCKSTLYFKEKNFKICVVYSAMISWAK
jgi:hypothetical protein